MSKPRKRGRPANPATRKQRILVRLHEHEEQAWIAAAQQAGHEQVSTWVRWVVNKAISQGS